MTPDGQRALLLLNPRRYLLSMLTAPSTFKPPQAKESCGFDPERAHLS